MEFQFLVSNFSFAFLNILKLSMFIVVELRSLDTSVESGLYDLGRLIFPPDGGHDDVENSRIGIEYRWIAVSSVGNGRGTCAAQSV
jgi:hypothetical protein